MARLSKKRVVRATSTVPIFLFAGLAYWTWDRGLENVISVLSPTAAAASTETQASTPASRLLTESDTSKDASKPIRLASLVSIREMLSQMVLAAGTQDASATASTKFAEADVKREEHAYPEAIRDYIMVIEQFPGTLQAKTADARANFVMERCSPEELDAIETLLPSPDDLKDIDSLTVVGQYHFLRATQLAETNPEQAQEHVQKIYEMGWRAFQDKLDDDYKMTILDAYLSAADMLGQGDSARKALSEHAQTLPTCFTAWLIRAVIDGNEPPFSSVNSIQAQIAVRKYYMTKAKAQSDPGASTPFYTKARDAAWQMLLAQPLDRPALDHCNIYLAAANGLGSEERDKAVAKVEEWIAAQPLSIMRWIVRYELAVFLTRPDCTGSEARAGYAHFGVMIDEGDTGLVERTVGDTTIDADTRGLLMCMWGHAHAGTNRVGEATQFYRWVLGYFPEETHAGESAAFAVAVMHEREDYGSLESCVDTYEEFVQNHPGGFYGPEALVCMAKRYLNEGDQTSALAVYERISSEYGNRSLAVEAEQQVEKLGHLSK